MAVNLSPVGGVAAQFFTNNAVPLSGGKLFTYAAGTTTPATTYTTAAGNVAQPNPIVLDAGGRVPGSGEIWLTDGVSYKFVLKDSNDVLIATYDNITGINSNFVNYTNQQEIQTATAGQTVFTLTTMSYQPGTNSLSVFVDGVNQYGPGAQYAYTETSDTVVTFASGLHVGALVKFTTSAINAASYGDACQISYTAPFTGAVGTSVCDKLAESASVLDFGVDNTGATDASTAIQTALANVGNKTLLFPAGTYLISLPIQFAANNQSIYMERGVTIQYTGTSAAISFEGKSYCVLGGFATIQCTNASGSGIQFTATAANNCLYNIAEFYSIANTQGRGAAPDVNSGIGIEMGPEVSGKVVYYNQVSGFRIADFNIGVLFDAINGSSGLGANANNVSIINMDNYWKGYKFRSIENTVRDTFFTGSAGNVTDSTYSFWFENSTNGNQIVNVSGEPGAYSIPYYIATGSNYNYISGALWNYGGANPTNSGTGNLIVNGRNLNSGYVIGSGLVENTKYKFGQVRVLNTRGGVVKVNWASRNSTTGYYSSGSATFLVWAQGGATVMMVSSEAAHSDYVQSTYTALAGISVSGYNCELIFDVRNYGGLDANTTIEYAITMTESCEFSQLGPTVHGGGLTYPIGTGPGSRVPAPVVYVTTANTELQQKVVQQSVANAGTVLLVNGNAGFGFVSTDGETMFFNVTAAGAVAKISGTANTAATNTAGNLCVYNSSGTEVRIINNLGSTKTVFGVFYLV